MTLGDSSTEVFCA